MDSDALDQIMTVLRELGSETGRAIAVESAKGTLQKVFSLVREKLRRRPKGELVLEEYAKDPDTWEKPLRKELVESGAADDPEIVATAKQALTLIGKQNIAMGKNVVQGDRFRDVLQIDQLNIGSPGEEVPDFFVSLNTYRDVLRPDLERDFEVKFPAEDRLLSFLHRGWEEFYTTHQGRKKRVVIGEHGRVDNIPVVRPKLSDETKKLITASYGVTNDRFARAIKWHRREAMLTIAGVTVTGTEGRTSYRELMDQGLAEHESDAILRLTRKGEARAKELTEEK